MKINNKGMSIIEIVVTFALIMVMIISMFTIVMNYRYKASISIEKLNMDTFKNTLTNDIQKDISSFGIDEINTEGECLILTDLQQCVNIVFKDGKQKAFGTSKINVDDLDSIENKYFYYDGIKYKLHDDLPDVIPEERSAIDFQKIKVEDNNLLSKDSTVLEDGTVVDIYSIDVFVSHVNFDDDFGIHIVATTEDISVISHDVNIISVTIDGKNSTSLPTSGTYALSSYKCKLGSILTWDMYEKKLTYSDFKVRDRCSLKFTKTTNYPLLTSVAKQGDYVAYEGNNGCMKNGTPITGDKVAESDNSCLGHNANETLVNDKYSGYCYNASHQFFVKGWRVAYKADNRTYLISAGAPECTDFNATFYKEADMSTSTELLVFPPPNTYYFSSSYILDASTGMYSLSGNIVEGAWNDVSSKVIGYYTCNKSSDPKKCDTIYKIDSIFSGMPTYYGNAYSMGTVSYKIESVADYINQQVRKYCNSNYVDGNCNDNSDIWAVNDNDFYKMTSIINGGTGYHLNSVYGTPYCENKPFTKCGYNNDLIDNGGDYNFSNDKKYSWDSTRRIVNGYASIAGLRPVIKLSTNIYVTGGSGTMDDPYTIIKK